MSKPSSSTAPEAAYLDRVDGLEDDKADLWAMSYGFKNAADMKAEGERMEREHMALASKRSPENE